MDLKFQWEYLSIKELPDLKLPDFTVLTGVNGAGKTHLLEAIENKAIQVENEGNNAKVVKFDYKTFFLENEMPYGAQQRANERNEAWSYYENNLKNTLSELMKYLPYDDQRVIVEIAKKTKTPFLGVELSNITNEDMRVQYDSARRNINNLLKQQLASVPHLYGIQPIIESASIPVDGISRNTFDDTYKPYQFKNDFLPQQLSRVIWDYYLKYRDNQINDFENTKNNKEYPVLSEEDFIVKHGDKPWEVINDILSRFGSIHYRLTSPEGRSGYDDFSVRLEDENGLQVDFLNLSSGEKILMALVASIYKSASDNRFPDILLLDEVDASLHPSMINNLLETINESFVKKGTKVILVTHSPTTVAICPEESIYVMNRASARVRIEKKRRSEALEILTEGFATLEQGLRIFDEIGTKDISIISEGNNTRYIQKALELYDINNVDVVTGVESASGANQLGVIFDFLCAVPHQKSVIVVWDCDVKTGRKEKGNTYPFIFSKNSTNTIATKGIENLFDKSLFEGFITETKKSNGDVIENFDTGRKADLEKKILDDATKEVFANFQPLIDKIESIE